MEENIYRYPPGGLIADYARAAVGLLCTTAPAVLMPLGTVTLAILAVLALLFLSFALHTLRRQRMRVRVSDSAISGRPGAVPLCWQDLTSVRLAYYSTRRDRRQGWMTLTLRAGKRALRVDSYIDGFIEIALRAARAAGANRLAVSSASLANFESLGIALMSESSFCNGNRRE
jgi:hypothetical protein